MKRSKSVITSAGILAVIALSGCTPDDWFNATQAQLMYGPANAIASEESISDKDTAQDSSNTN